MNRNLRSGSGAMSLCHNKIRKRSPVSITLVLICVLPFSSCAQSEGSITRVKFGSQALNGNLIGDPAERELLVLLPPSYQGSSKRYPSVYYLHGLGTRSSGHLSSEGIFLEFLNSMRKDNLQEMILVAIDGTTVFGGSYYSDSPTIGNFEAYVAEEIVSLVDSLYRTRPESSHRAIAGFSMGGHGSIKIAMKYPDVFGRVGSLSGSPLSMRFRKSIYKKALADHTKPKSVEDLVNGIRYEDNWSLAAAYAKAAAFSPNAFRPPLYVDLPFEKPISDEKDPVWQKWLDDDPLSLVSKYKENLSELDQIYLDHGDDETTLGTEDFIRELVRYDIGLTHYIFRGDHVDELTMRHMRLLRHLSISWQPDQN